MLAKSDKLNWGIGHQALKVIYNGAIETNTDIWNTGLGESLNKT
jgi:hypothetical protein